MRRRRRLLLLVVLALLGGLFVGPVRSYRASQAHLREAQAELRAVEQQRDERRRVQAELRTRPALIREARRQGYVFPGEIAFAVAAP